MVADVVVAVDLHLAVVPGEAVRAGQLVNVFEHRLGIRDILDAQIFGQAAFIEGFVEARVGQKALDLAAEDEVAALIVVVIRLDAEDVPRAEEGLGAAVPDDKGEHPAQPGRQGVAPFLIAVQQDFGIRLGGKGMPGRQQFGAQVLVVVDFAVVNDDKVAVLVVHRLAAAFKVDDRKPAVAQRDLIVNKIALAVGAAVGNQVGHLFYNGTGLVSLVAAFGKAGDPTHGRSLPCK